MDVSTINREIPKHWQQLVSLGQIGKVIRLEVASVEGYTALRALGGELSHVVTQARKQAGNHTRYIDPAIDMYNAGALTAWNGPRTKEARLVALFPCVSDRDAERLKSMIQNALGSEKFQLSNFEWDMQYI